MGDQNDVPHQNVPEDFDGEGRADVSVFRPSNRVWHLLRAFQAAHHLATSKFSMKDMLTRGRLE